MRLIVISGRSGSGKSTALHVLEDEGFYCIDNMPAALLAPLVTQMQLDTTLIQKGVAVSIDARNTVRDLAAFPQILHDIRSKQDIDCEVIYLDADRPTLIRRFSETRRKHPLSDSDMDLSAAIEAEKQLLEPIADIASLTIDTRNLNLYQLRDLVLNRVVRQTNKGMSLLFLSFGYKNGIPVDADLVFDARCLPNPYWKTELRPYTGLDEPVQTFLAGEAEVQKMLCDIQQFLQSWLPMFQQNRRYMTVAIGCTGGHHRSVFLSEKLNEFFSVSYGNTQVRHREIGAST